MSFIDFCFVLFLIWIVLFVILLFYLDGDLSLMWHAKFGRKIYELKDQVVWITGASTGIGASCAIEAAKLGAKLVLSARNEVLLKEVKEKCLGKNPRKPSLRFLLSLRNVFLQIRVDIKAWNQRTF